VCSAFFAGEVLTPGSPTRERQEMAHISRRQLIGGAAATAAAVTLNSPSVHAQKGRQTLRFIAEADLKILGVDPVLRK